jgi:hypothetical protein
LHQLLSRTDVTLETFRDAGYGKGSAQEKEFKKAVKHVIDKVKWNKLTRGQQMAIARLAQPFALRAYPKTNLN